MTLALAGFASTLRRIRVTTGENVDVVVVMKVTAVAETVEVQAETPLVDSRRRGTATTLTSEELALVPNARDPWGVLKAVPGVAVERRQHRGQPERPAAQRVVEGPAAIGEHLEPRRHGDHRHGRRWWVIGVLRFRRLRGDHRHDRRHGPRDGHGRRRHQHHHQARHERLPRQRALPRRRRAPLVRQHRRPGPGAVRAERPRDRSAPAQPRRHVSGSGRPDREPPGLRLRARRPGARRQAVVLRELRQAGHRAAANGRHAGRRRCCRPGTPSSTGKRRRRRRCRRTTSSASSRGSAA